MYGKRKLKTVIGVLGAAIVGIGAYFLVSGPARSENLRDLLNETLPEATQVSLEECDLRLVSERVGPPHAPFALIRVAIRVDMKRYNFENIQLFPRENQVIYRVARNAASNEMIDQAEAIFGARDVHVAQDQPSRDALRDVLDTKDGNLSIKVKAVSRAEGDLTILTASADAPAFYDFTQAVEALTAPVSYQMVTSHTAGGPNATTLLNGEVIVVPPLQLSFKDQDTARAVAQAFYDYTSANCV